jgi:hypothetical protein
LKSKEVPGSLSDLGVTKEKKEARTVEGGLTFVAHMMPIDDDGRAKSKNVEM